MALSAREETIRQILIWQGVANQLLTTRFNRLLADHNLPLAQFIMLNHFRSFPGEGHTITRLANAFETGQPGISKLVRRLVDKGFLRVEPHEKDGRVKLHYLTPVGEAAYMKALKSMAPEASLIFDDWTDEELMTLNRVLFRLKSWLDDHRDVHAREPACPETGPREAAS